MIFLLSARFSRCSAQYRPSSPTAAQNREFRGLAGSSPPPRIPLSAKRCEANLRTERKPAGFTVAEWSQSSVRMRPLVRVELAAALADREAA